MIIFFLYISKFHHIIYISKVLGKTFHRCRCLGSYPSRNTILEMSNHSAAQRNTLAVRKSNPQGREEQGVLPQITWFPQSPDLIIIIIMASVCDCIKTQKTLRWTTANSQMLGTTYQQSSLKNCREAFRTFCIFSKQSFEVNWLMKTSSGIIFGIIFTFSPETFT